MMQHLPILQVLLPLLGAPLAALLRGRDMAWGLALSADRRGFFDFHYFIQPAANDRRDTGL